MDNMPANRVPNWVVSTLVYNLVAPSVITKIFLNKHRQEIMIRIALLVD